MRLLKTAVMATALCAVTPIVGWCADADASLPAWKPDPALTTRLTTPVSLGTASIQMPEGWKLQPTPSHVIAVYRFSPPGAPSAKAAPSREFVISTQVHGTNWSPASTLHAAVSRRTSKATGVKESPIEHGSLQGYSAWRVYAKMTSHGMPARLFAYVVDDGSATATIVGYDATPATKENLTLLDAAALTFVLSLNVGQEGPPPPAPPPSMPGTPPPPDTTPPPIAPPPPDTPPVVPPPDTLPPVPAPVPPPDQPMQPDPTPPPPDQPAQPDPTPPPDMAPQPDPAPPPDAAPTDMPGQPPMAVPISDPIGPQQPMGPGTPIGPYEPQGPGDPQGFPDQQPTDPGTDPRQPINATTQS